MSALPSARSEGRASGADARLRLHGNADLPALRLVRPPAVARRVAAALALLMPVLVVLLLVVPWQQAAVGAGRVVAYAPAERQQQIDAPVDGRLAEWLVVEGEQVRADQPLVRLVDNDPDLVARLLQQREAAIAAEVAAGEQVRSYESKLAAAEAALGLVVAEYDSKIQGLRRKRVGEQVGFDAAVQQEGRIRTLRGEGIASPRDAELAALSLAKSEASLQAMDAEISAVRNARDKAARDAEAKIASARAELEAARAKVAEARQKVTDLDVKLARQETQLVRAPREGVVLRVHGGAGGGQVKKGDLLVTLVPETSSRAVELWVDGNDMPLARKGRPVRLLFEGWPALQFVGLPGGSRGTFGGRVAFVDAADDGKGKFRIVVVPDEESLWPAPEVLRQGVRAKGWVLLDRVTLGYELWRQVNGFPIQPDLEKGTKPTLPSGKKPRTPAELR